MHIGSLHSVPQKISVFTGRDSITGENYLGALGDAAQSGIALFPSDVAAQISAEFAPYRAIAERAAVMPKQIQTQVNGWTQWQGNPAYVQAVMSALKALPTWYAAGGTWGVPSVPFLNVQQGANGNTGYVSYRVITRNGLKIWEVPYQYGLNEGTQTITNAMAAAAGGIPTPVGGYTIQSGAAIIGPRWMFLQDPRPYLAVGQIGAGYVGGRSGKSITMEAVKGIAIVVGSVVGGALIGAALGPAVGAAGGGAGAGAGTAAGAAADLYAVAPGAIAVSSGAPVVAAGTTAVEAAAATAGAAGAATGIAAPALVTSAATGAGTTGLSIPGIIAGAKTAAGVLATVTGVQKALTAAKPSGGASGAPPALVPDYGGGSGYGGGLPTGGVDFFSQSIAGVPLWLLIVGGGAAVYLATRRKRK
jgi:hypothetical protein